jgi:hypothetical protein
MSPSYTGFERPSNGWSHTPPYPLRRVNALQGGPHFEAHCGRWGRCRRWEKGLALARRARAATGAASARRKEQPMGAEQLGHSRGQS